mgnify:CR=1 FL=1
MALTSSDIKNLDIVISRFSGKNTVTFSKEDNIRFSSILDDMIDLDYIYRIKLDGGRIYARQVGADLATYVEIAKRKFKDEKREHRFATHKEIFIALISAIAGSIITLIGDHFTEIINFVKGIF